MRIEGANNLRWGEGHQNRHELGHESIAREAIIAAATVCYIKLGMKTSCSDIALEAKITRPTIYRYFEGSDAIRLAVVRRIWEGLRPEHGLAIEWLDSLRSAHEYRLGKLKLSDELFEDLTTVLLTRVDSIQHEGCARLFLSYLRIEPMCGSPLPLFQALAGIPAGAVGVEIHGSAGSDSIISRNGDIATGNQE